MDDDIYEKYRHAGEIAAEARDYGAELIKPGVRFLDVANNVESRIKKRGADLSFPVNISINEIAAHFSPRHDDTLVFKKGEVVKLDVGSHIDGYIADTAVTVEVGSNKYGEMIKASSEALENAINHVKAGVDLSEVGKIVEDTIKSYGYRPIDNLTGHSLQQYELHSGMSVPSVANTSHRVKPKLGDVLAIEPFATNGAGHVIAGAGSNIYLCNQSFRSKIIRDNRSKIMFNKISSRFNTLPFAQRWCQNLVSDGFDPILKRLSFLGLIKHYPQLIDAKGGIVTQKEHTVIVEEGGCEVIT
ncbi:MAG: type II methionyl aminopeptidase [Candidatus Thermoplasmatota archaeon]|nr:type II methionyl aminopeptidase [Candidatus Thermoplasmatota archaeon]